MIKKYCVLYDNGTHVGLDRFEGFTAVFNSRKKAKQHLKWRRDNFPGIHYRLMKRV